MMFPGQAEPSRWEVAFRESLPEIQFYPTVTNLKLQTSEGRLHVHVTEDVNEIIPYPSSSSVQHLDTPAHIQGRDIFIRESDLEFDAHLSGFVYKVRFEGCEFIKKEIPGPDTVDEFLYEINALHAYHPKSDNEERGPDRRSNATTSASSTNTLAGTLGDQQRRTQQGIPMRCRSEGSRRWTG